jgi:hypothetical protein
VAMMRSIGVMCGLVAVTAAVTGLGHIALPVSAGDRKRTVAAVVVGFGVPDSVPCP